MTRATTPVIVFVFAAAAAAAAASSVRSQDPPPAFKVPTPSHTRGHDVLRQRAVTLSIDKGSTTASCLGYRIGSPNVRLSDIQQILARDSIDVVLTAAHCFQDSARNTVKTAAVTARTIDAPPGFPLLSTAKNVKVEYKAQQIDIVVWAQEDLAFVLMYPRMDSIVARTEPEYAGLVTPVLNPAKGRNVVAYVSIAGGLPTFTSGTVEGVDGNWVELLMAGGCGSSGGGVVDVDGNLVGAISKGRGSLDRLDCAGHNVFLVSAAFIKSRLDDPTERSRIRLAAERLLASKARKQM